MHKLEKCSRWVLFDAYTKTKTAYPTDEALKKIIYLATVEASKKWTMPIKEWKKCISQFAIHFGDRLQSELGI